MMKKVLFGLGVAAMLAACGSKPEVGYVVEGQIADADAKMVYLKQYNDRAFDLVDSAEVVGGQFKFMGVALQDLAYGLTTDKASRNPLVFFIGNEHFKVQMDEENNSLQTEGSAMNDLYKQNVEQVGTDQFDINQFVAQHPASAVGPYFVMRNMASTIDLDLLKQVRGALDASLNNNRYVQQMDDLIVRKEAVQPGQVAPDFTLPDADGNMVSLSSFRGKYLLLNFWASWCPDCRAENPFLVEAYKKYKSKNMEVLGVSLDRTREAWLAGIEKENLTWKQVSDLKAWNSPVTELYAMRWIPTSLLLDPDGKILNVSLNATELEANLKSVFEK